MKAVLSAIYWNYSNVLWKSDAFPFRLSWYGVCFSCGILLSAILGIYLALSRYPERDSVTKEQLRLALENFSLYSLLFIIPGARIAYILFYGGDFYFEHPIEMLKVWNGGLASHGGIIGLLIWAMLYTRMYRSKIPFLTFLFLCDMAASVFGCAAFLIRIGNFMNQEIVGVPTELPWGVIFSSLQQGYPGVAVHPVQIYEGVGYVLLSSFIFLLVYKRYWRLGDGYATSAALIGVALIRFFAEFFKSHQGRVVSTDSLLSIGQMLSLPLFIFGICLGIFCFLKKKRNSDLTRR